MKNKKMIIRIGFIGVILIMLIILISLQVQIKELEKEKEMLEEIVGDYRITVEEMEYNLTLPKEDYIEKYAREILGYHKYSDIIIKEETDE